MCWINDGVKPLPLLATPCIAKIAGCLDLEVRHTVHVSVNINKVDRNV
jgi:hypothetical protein